MKLKLFLAFVGLFLNTAIAQDYIQIGTAAQLVAISPAGRKVAQLTNEFGFYRYDPSASTATNSDKTVLKPTGANGRWIAFSPVAGVSLEELRYLIGVNSPIQAQIDGVSGGGVTVGTLINTANSAAGQIAVFSDNTKTNIVPSSGVTNLTLVTPTISDLSNATHDHQSNAKGGSLSAAAIGSGTLNAARLPASAKTRSIEIYFTGYGSALTASLETEPPQYIPIGFTISKVTIAGNTTGSAVVDIWIDSRANFPPTVADTITASAKPTLSSDNENQDSTLTGWTKTIPDGSYIKAKLESVSGLSFLTITLEGE